MTELEKLKHQLETTGLPLAYRAFPEEEAPLLPFLCYLVTGSDNLVADGGVYYNANVVHVELYTKEKDPITEDKVEQALSSYSWDKTEEYIDSEKCYQIIYEIEV